MQKERLEEMKKELEIYLQKFPDPESGSLIILDNFKEYILNSDDKDILDYIFEKSGSANRNFYLQELLSPRYFSDEIRKLINDINKDLQGLPLVFQDYILDTKSHLFHLYPSLLLCVLKAPVQLLFAETLDIT